jgi:DNA-binding transcriptional MerR regulator
MNTETTDSADRTWWVSELAEATGLSVRALHHYDEIGLLHPSHRSSAGHRLYVADDVRRLHRIVALRGFGLSLAEIGQVLDGVLTDPRDLIRRQLDQVEEQIAVAIRLRRSLLGVLGGLDSAHEPSAQKLIELIEVMTTMTRSLTTEELEELSENRRRRAEKMSPEEFAAAAEARRKAVDELSAEALAELQQRRAALMPEA